MSEEIRAEFGIGTKDGIKTYLMSGKKSKDINKCEIGKIVVLFHKDQSQWTGLFETVEDGYAIISDLEDPSKRIGFPLDLLEIYFEEIEVLP